MPARRPKTADGPYAEGAFSPPPWLGEVALASHRRLVGDLRASGNLSRTDPGLVTAYAIQEEVLAHAYAALKVDGHYVKGDRGGTVRHPALDTANQATLRLKTLASEMGLTPASLGIVSTPPKKKESSPIADMIAGDE